MTTFFFNKNLVINYFEEVKNKFSDFSFEIPFDRIITRETLNTYMESIPITCNNSIGNEYLNKKINKTLSFDKPPYNYQIIVLKKNNKICGFMIVKQGICKRNPDIYGISLICSDQPRGGTCLLGLFLYIILINDSIQEKKAVLELAAAFTNKGGFCLYEKFGFKEDPTLFGDDCFNDYDNLPMINDFSIFTSNTTEKKVDTLIDIVLGVNTRSKSPFCSINRESMNIYDYNLDKLLKDLKNVCLIMQYPITTEEIISHINEAYDNIYEKTKNGIQHLKMLGRNNEEEKEEDEFNEVKEIFESAIIELEDTNINTDNMEFLIYNFFTYDSGSESSQNSESSSQTGGSRKRKRKTRNGKISKKNRNRTRIKYRQRKKINRKRTKKYKTRHF